MRLILHPRSLYILGGVLVFVVPAFFLIQFIAQPKATRITTEVTRGEVTEIVPVSGVVESNSTSDLAFKATDIVDTVLVDEGDEVMKGDVLALLQQDDLLADRKRAIAALEIARADRDELIAGPRSEERDVTTSEVESAKANLTRTIERQDELVENARRALLSTDLEALPEDPDNDNVPPTISGTYTCNDTGTYEVNILSGGTARTKYTYRLIGLEVGTYVGYEEAPTAMGTCGLLIQFDDNSDYESDDFTILVPNTRSSSYVTNYNTYQLALQTRDNEIQSAEENLDQILKEQTLENASPRDEELRRANATVLQAEAELATVESHIADRTLTAPFSGTITSVDIVEGETNGTEPAMTIIGDGVFELTARIPEIDIAKIAVEQESIVIFDARASEEVPATISFISPLATEIDGVAYFEAQLLFENPPSWLRAGLNADIDIVTRREMEALRIPKRFLLDTDSGHVVYVPEGRDLREIPITVTFLGNDGFAAITGLNEGDVVVSP